jgi:putative acetyltransferase
VCATIHHGQTDRLPVLCAPSDPELLELLQQADIEFLVRYPELLGRRRGRLSAGIRFLILRRAGEPVGCCGSQECVEFPAGNTFELKRLYVVPRARGTGAADSLLRAFEQLSVNMGARSVCFETGERQPESIAVGLRNGYRPVTAYPPYCNDPFARCFVKTLIQV